MESITKCLNEWNATLEALGKGKQTILIRKYNTSVDKFLLYPTTSYTMKDDFLKSFKKEYQSFAEKNALPKQNNGKSEVKYCATVEKVVEKPSTRIGSLNKYHIWTNDHVKSYLGSGKGYVWVLRVYELDEPVMLDRTRGLLYANVSEGVSLKGKPVLSDSEFNEIYGKIK
ncbi:DUF1802 family protein [Methanobacterium alkalithermotolerans]|uniref:DUF1802 family protein n=1 Tax=Methanobacterium alkalithermotolerans TaxID=2731220 RepID=A0A8T8K880_9EURY|nr:DUF1802 family protein [Methanobacterium alkalithermotolerans]QUH24247.1 DUF1802 family protein [Methanobacterium alkalithermotolerans]